MLHFLKATYYLSTIQFYMNLKQIFNMIMVFIKGLGSLKLN